MPAFSSFYFLQIPAIKRWIDLPDHFNSLISNMNCSISGIMMRFGTHVALSQVILLFRSIFNGTCRLQESSDKVIGAGGLPGPLARTDKHRPWKFFLQSNKSMHEEKNHEHLNRYRQ
ncbi:hypothetical protein [Desulfofustis glycolicus]|uniref:hypothetical protein n=1 Tax=Desulfofustis glycolicus TaxID=51195 RepID=UPI00137AA560|nr:hypothetical protein [Desulfofustis glycolicus]MCB2218648.1 hypothetical protein [Desulfobulbaceae bacterium]